MYAEKARRGEFVADAVRYGPPIPEGFWYLRQWLFELHGRSGMGMNGLAPLSYATIADWSHLTGQSVEPYEVEALLMLDGILLHPDEQKNTTTPAESIAPPKRGWPSKKAAPVEQLRHEPHEPEG